MLNAQAERQARAEALRWLRQGTGPLRASRPCRIPAPTPWPIKTSTVIRRVERSIAADRFMDRALQAFTADLAASLGIFEK